MPPLYHLSFSDLREGGIACQHLQLPRKRALRASPNVFPTNHHYKLTAHRKRQNEDTRNFAKLDMRCSELTFTMKKTTCAQPTLCAKLSAWTVVSEQSFSRRGSLARRLHNCVQSKMLERLHSLRAATISQISGGRRTKNRSGRKRTVSSF